MSQADLGTLPPSTTTGTALAALLTAWRDALHSSHKGNTAPSYKVNGTIWIDDTSATANLLKVYDGTNWIVLLSFNPASDAASARFDKGADIASAAALTIPTHGNFFDVTGTVAITSINSAASTGASKLVALRFTGAGLTLTHHATNLILPGGANIQTAAGDEAIFVEYGSGTWRCINYQTAQSPDIIEIVNGRLTLTTGTPVTTADVTAASTLYFTPHKGNAISLYSGSGWRLYTFTERSLALSGLTASRPYDVFIYDNAGTLTLEVVAWTNDTTRATALAKQDGVYVKTGATGRRYLGTIYTTGTTTTEDSKAKRFVWNMYNRVPRPMAVFDGTDTWTYSLATYRQANGAAANQLDFVRGIDEDAVEAICTAQCANSTGGVAVKTAVGLDSTTAAAAYSTIGSAAAPSANQLQFFSRYCGLPGLGRHFLAWLEYSVATGTTTWRGDDGAPTLNRNGIVGTVYA